MRIHRAHCDARLLDSPPPAERVKDSPTRSHDTLRRKQGRNIPEGHMRGHEYDAKRMTLGIVGDALRRKHHRHVDIADEVCQPLGVTGVGKTCEVKGVLVSGGCDDGVDFSAERESDGEFDGVAGDAACADDAFTILAGVSTAEAPDTYRYSTLSWYIGDLVFGTHDRDVGIERLGQRATRDLGTDAAGVTQRHRDPRGRDLFPPARPSRLSRLSRPSRQIRISTYVDFRSRSR
jgi:hypothetical protein